MLVINNLIIEFRMAALLDLHEGLNGRRESGY